MRCVTTSQVENPKALLNMYYQATQEVTISCLSIHAASGVVDLRLNHIGRVEQEWNISKPTVNQGWRKKLSLGLNPNNNRTKLKLIQIQTWTEIA